MMVFRWLMFPPYLVISFCWRTLVAKTEIAFANTVECIHSLSNSGDARACTPGLINFVKNLARFSGIKAVSGVVGRKDEVH
jgi:hypothetical protein